MVKFHIKSYLNIILLISLFSIIYAYFLEYVIGYQPCNLCLIQRIPYVVSIILIIVNNIFKDFEKFIVFLLFITFVFSLAISFYHFGIEQGFFNESPICEVKNTTQMITKEDILKKLDKIPISCKDVTFRIFGLSLTSINMLLSLILSCFLLKIFYSYEKK
tara:strand:- start:11 stop:493 length:483 start_codon:yes stop_codon:yes gene_type:complete